MPGYGTPRWPLTLLSACGLCRPSGPFGRPRGLFRSSPPHSKPFSLHRSRTCCQALPVYPLFPCRPGLALGRGDSLWTARTGQSWGIRWSFEFACFDNKADSADHLCTGRQARPHLPHILHRLCVPTRGFEEGASDDDCGAAAEQCRGQITRTP